ncbi:hypothetical protein UA08_08232 [Talaromyces atroroseus]|uniref:Cytidyltransferase-like domain-containing protein n=1 Tax=Talaromyces atroroseus TaxID=1441469 RepID=A0A225A7L8_TALAT|nr:hypothetical protein UA08_08232 [Talaromyces atroroseus]OKL56522.1 hypothetical protein UA08_08232 [Talaromyces atroroseus]
MLGGGVELDNGGRWREGVQGWVPVCDRIEDEAAAGAPRQQELYCTHTVQRTMSIQEAIPRAARSIVLGVELEAQRQAENAGLRCCLFTVALIQSQLQSDAMAAPYGLLLLPTPPSPAVRQLKEVYGPALSHIFSDAAVQLKGSSNIYKLDIGLVIPHSLGGQYQPRSKAFASIQHLLANFYTLVGATSASYDVELDVPGGVDVRVFLVDPSEQSQFKDSQRVQGPVIDLATLATSQRSWDQIYVPDTDGGELLIAAFLKLDVSIPSKKLPIGNVSVTPQTVITPDDRRSTSHSAVIVGGTFDHLHIGHKLLLTATALALDHRREEQVGSRPRSLVVGITGDEMLVNKKFAEYLESWEERWQNTAAFLRAIIDFSPPGESPPDIQRTEKPGPNGKQVSFQVAPDLTVRLVQIADPFGPTIAEEDLGALIVSAETRSGGQAVNAERNKRGWASLEVFEVDVLQAGEAEAVADTSASGFEAKISSTDIRQRRMKSANSSL